jgi:hypothetical protein
MTKTEIHKAKLDFEHFIANLLDQYEPNDSECYILYGSFIHSLSDEIVKWGYIDKESEDDE